MGLIDADKIINRLDAVTKDGGENVKVFSINDIKYLLNNEPTAYDVDKVVEQLKSESARWQDSGDAYNDEKGKRRCDWISEGNRDCERRWCRCEDRFLNLLENWCTKNTTVIVLTAVVKYQKRVSM